MADNNGNWLKSNWLALGIIGLILAVGVAWGITQNQQKTNTKEIEKKVDTKLFQMFMQNNEKQLGEVNKKLEELLKK